MQAVRFRLDRDVICSDLPGFLSSRYSEKEQKTKPVPVAGFFYSALRTST
jgi:hypothetical protein